MDGPPLDLKSLFDLVTRRGLLVALVVFTALAAAGIAIVLLRPVYTATAMVLVDPSKKDLLTPVETGSNASSDSLRVDSEVELVKSQTTLLSVVDELRLASDPEFGPRPGLLVRLGVESASPLTAEEARQQALANVGHAITVQRRSGTLLIAIQAKSSRRDFAAELANAVARTYIDQQLRVKRESALQSAEVIKARIAEASAKVAELEDSLNEFIDQNLDAIVEATGRTDLKQLQLEVRSLAEFRASAAPLIEAASRYVTGGQWVDLATTLDDPLVRELVAEQQQLTSALEGQDPEAPEAADTHAKIDAVESQLRVAANKIVAGLRNDLANAQARAPDLRAKLQAGVLASQLPANLITGVYELQQSAEIARTQYQTLLKRQNDLDTQAFLQLADSRLVTQARSPSDSSFPNIRLILLLAVAGGLIGGIALAFIVEHVVGGFTSEHQIRSILRPDGVSSVPRATRKSGRGRTVAEALVSTPLSLYSESVRRLRVSIDQLTRRSTEAVNHSGIGLVIMVTSTFPGEGKSSTALSLARAYALAGYSTVLVDCDLRRPAIHDQLELGPSRALSEYLSSAPGEVRLADIVRSDPRSPAGVVLGCPGLDDTPDQLLAGSRFRELLSEAQQSYRVVILDTPPVGLFADGLLIAPMVGAIVLVTKWAATPQQRVRETFAALAEAKRETASLLSVLNQNKPRSRAQAAYSAYYSRKPV